MPLNLLKSPRMPTGFNTHSVDGTTELGVYAPGSYISGGTDDLDARWYRPLGIDPTIPLPCVVWINTASFILSNSSAGAIAAEWFTQCGMAFLLVRTRVDGQAPSESDGASKGATNQLGHTMNAIRNDVYRAMKYAQSNPVRDFVTIEPKWCFLGGTSSGGMGAMFATIEHATSFYTPGLILVSTALGLDDAAGALHINMTSEMRTDLGYTEADLTGTPPICYFCKKIDSVISTSPNDWQGDMRTVVEGFGGDSIVHLDETADAHINLHQWDEPDGLTGASTIQEAIYNFAAARCTATTPFAGGFKF